jgi:hypothetical protein
MDSNDISLEGVSARVSISRVIANAESQASSSVESCKFVAQMLELEKAMPAKAISASKVKCCQARFLLRHPHAVEDDDIVE